MNKNTFTRSYTSNSRQMSLLGSVTTMIEQTRWFYNKMTTDSDSECSYVANFADFNVIKVIIIVIVIKIIVIQIVYNRKKSNKCTNSNNYSNNSIYNNNSNNYSNNCNSNKSNNSNINSNNIPVNFGKCQKGRFVRRSETWICNTPSSSRVQCLIINCFLIN